jgi:hypothetical protein
MVTNSFRSKKFHATNEKAQHTLKGGPSLFLSGFWGDWQERIQFVFLVPNVFPQDVPNITTLLSHMLCLKFNFHIYKL